MTIIEQSIKNWAIAAGTTDYRGMKIPESYWRLQEATIALARNQSEQDLTQALNTLALLQMLVNTTIVASKPPYDVKPAEQIEELITRIPQNIEHPFLAEIVTALNKTPPDGPGMAKLFKELLAEHRQIRLI